MEDDVNAIIAQSTAQAMLVLNEQALNAALANADTSTLAPTACSGSSQNQPPSWLDTSRDT
jgi:hypothetical protein